jgi:type I restriction enzyme, S subunit
MSSEWRYGRLGDFIELKRGYDLPQASRRPGAFPLVSSSGVTDSHDEAMVRGPGVVTGRYGTIGQVYFVEQDFWPLNTTLYVRDFKGNDPKFVSYFLRTLDFFAYSDKAAVPGVNRNHLHEALAALPCKAAQAAIADCLGALDDRIALLRETNATLEAIAQALFKSWFVDFDPVHAKSQGLAPASMDEATAALFPDSFEESALGPVPAGWACIDLGELTRRCGGAIQTGPFGSQLHAKDYVENGIPVVMPKDIVGRRVSTDSIARVAVADVERLARHKLQAGDIVFSRRGDVERHALITEREVGWLCGTGCLLVRPGPVWQSPGFLSLLFDAPRARTWLVQHAVGATMANLNTGILSSVPVALPSPALLAAFDAVVAVTDEQRSLNATMAETLAETRDALLPRLVSGQLRLPEAERAEAAIA